MSENKTSGFRALVRKSFIEALVLAPIMVGGLYLAELFGG